MQEMPLFPLSLFLLPGDYTQLHIFEERYKQLVRYCEDTELPFGIPFSNRINTRNLCSLVVLDEIVKRYEGGEMDIVVRCVGVARLHQFYYQHEGYLFPGGRVKILNLPEQALASEGLNKEFRRFMESREEAYELALEQEELTLFEMANRLNLNDSERLELVNLQAEEKIESYLHNYLRYLELLQEQEENAYQNIYLN